MTTYFVTGGSGFVGGRVVRDLRARGDAVYALARSPRSAGRIRRAGAEPVDGDLEDPVALRDGMRGADVVIHAGAKVDDWGRPAEFERVNVEGTRNVLWAMQRAGVPRIVFVSPVTVLATGRPLVRADEQVAPPGKALGWYHRSKLESERWILESAGEGIEPVIVRPATAWGPGDRVWLPRFRELVRTGRFRWVDFGRHQVSTTHVANAAHGLVLAADRGTPGSVYHLSDGEPVELRAFVTRYLATAGVKAPKRNVTPRGGRMLARSGERIWGFLGAKKAPPLTWATFVFIGLECTVDDAKARSELGYTPVVEHEQAMEELAAAAEAKRRGRSTSGPTSTPI